MEMEITCIMRYSSLAFKNISRWRLRPVSKNPRWCALLRSRQACGTVKLFKHTVRKVPRFHRYSAYSLQHGLLLGGILGFFGFGSEEEDGKVVPPSIKRQLLKAQRALRSGPDYEEAERAYHKALELLAVSVYSSSQAYQEARAVTLDKLANLYLEQGKFDMAEVTFKEALKVMITAGLEQTDDAVVEISLKLSKVYSNQKKYELASTGFHWCVNTARDNWKQNETENGHALLGMCLHGEGQYHLVVGENSSAAAVLSEALKIAQLVYGEKHLQVAVLHNDLATAVDRLGDHAQAEHLIRQSIEITESLETQSGVTVGEVLEHLVTYYTNLAVIQSNNGSSSIAEESFSTAMRLAEKSGERTLVQHVKRERNKCSYK